MGYIYENDSNRPSSEWTAQQRKDFGIKWQKALEDPTFGRQIFEGYPHFPQEYVGGNRFMRLSVIRKRLELDKGFTYFAPEIGQKLD